MTFRNEPILELRRAAARESLLEALRSLDARLPLPVPMRIGDDRSEGDGVVSTDPGNPERVVARAARASEADAAAAVETAQRGFRAWSARSAEERANTLRGAAARLRDRRLELAALQVRECAKPWPEADGDVCEAIDFLEYYAREAVELDRGRELVQVPGERNTMRYAPRGVAAVIAPWNFPLAIPCGMTAAALAAGNAAILKPAEQSPGSAGVLVDALHEAGVPRDALALLPGFGEAGAALVRDPRVHVIAFTGSAPVGLEIVRASAETPDGQPHVKRVVAEMGGKNCVIVDADADLDEAVPGIVHSAFGYAGPEVLGRGPRAGARGDRGHAGGAARGRGRGAAGGPGRGVRHRGPAGDRARGAGAGAALPRACLGPRRRLGRCARFARATSARRPSPPACRRTRRSTARRSSARSSR